MVHQSTTGGHHVIGPLDIVTLYIDSLLLRPVSVLHLMWKV